MFWSNGFVFKAANGEVYTLFNRSKNEWDVSSAAAIAFFCSVFSWKFGLKSDCISVGLSGVYLVCSYAIANY